MKSLSILITVLILSNFSFSQTTNLDFAKRIFESEIKNSDFKSGQIFLTLDTVNAGDVNAPSTYVKAENPAEIIKMFKSFMKSVNFKTGMFGYGELINSPFYESSVHIMFFVNSDSNTYRVDLWTAKEDTSKLEGLTVCKYAYKIKPSSPVN